MVTFHPGSELNDLGPAVLELGEDILRQGRGLAPHEDQPELPLKILGWLIAQDGHVPDAIQVEAEGGEVAGRRSEEEVLGLPVGPACRLLAAEAGDALIFGLGWLLRRWHGSVLRPDP